jgi:protoheme IX farnesyltransferase
VTARLRLAKAPLCLLLGFAVFFGTLLANSDPSLSSVFVALAVALVAAGAASLNSLQERHLDGKMARTRNRPIPAGYLTVRQATWQVVFLFSCGMILLLKTSTLSPTLLTLCGVFLYNGVYTPLKRTTILAIIPGAVCGAIPAYVGWLDGGGPWLSFPVLLLFALFFLWQIPHFWLILLGYSGDYVAGDMPNLLNLLCENRLKRFFITWIGALAIVMSLFVTLPYPLAGVARPAIIVNGLVLVGLFTIGLQLWEKPQYRVLFRVLNGSLLLHMLIVGIGRVAG